MFETLKNLVFSGAAFTTETTLELFTQNKSDKSSERLCLIYGKNGTGKSTISKAVLKLTGAEVPEISNARLEDQMCKTISYPIDAQSSKIFVFNEEYIQNNVRIKDDGLGTIVMFGKQAELEMLIDAAQTEYEKASAEAEKLANELAPYNDETSLISPNYYLSKMKHTLSGDECWAGRERLINGNRRNASVNNDTYKNIMQTIPEKEYGEIKKDYQRQYDLLCDARSGNALITATVNTKIPIFEGEDSARILLARKIEKPILSEREKYLLSLLSEGKNKQIE